jgi:hypothetical protein
MHTRATNLAYGARTRTWRSARPATPNTPPPAAAPTRERTPPRSPALTHTCTRTHLQMHRTHTRMHLHAHARKHTCTHACMQPPRRRDVWLRGVHRCTQLRLHSTRSVVACCGVQRSIRVLRSCAAPRSTTIVRLTSRWSSRRGTPDATLQRNNAMRMRHQTCNGIHKTPRTRRVLATYTPHWHVACNMQPARDARTQLATA